MRQNVLPGYILGARDAPLQSMKTPVALFIYKRPQTTKKVLQIIRQVKPIKLFVIADGPRSDEDIAKCRAARALIEEIDWNCEVIKHYSDEFLGCGQRVATGISWVFEQVEETIILEDDCVPHPTFFDFCETLLDVYRHDERVMVISGNNFQFGRQRTDYSYYFSCYPHTWGWATWRRAWQYYDYHMKLWTEIRNDNWLIGILQNVQAVKYWTKIFQETYAGNPKVWDYQWTFTCWSQGGLTVIPNVNLVTNIGFGQEGTNTTKAPSNLANIPVQGMKFPMSYPPYMIQHKEADHFTQAQIFQPSLTTRIVRKIVFYKYLPSSYSNIKHNG